MWCSRKSFLPTVAICFEAIAIIRIGLLSVLVFSGLRVRFPRIIVYLLRKNSNGQSFPEY